MGGRGHSPRLGMSPPLVSCSDVVHRLRAWWSSWQYDAVCETPPSPSRAASSRGPTPGWSQLAGTQGGR
eukprot:35283-Pyramimonas_sp.AAC.1